MRGVHLSRIATGRKAVKGGQKCGRLRAILPGKRPGGGVMLYEDPLRYWPQFAAALGIVVGTAGGFGAAVQTGELWRYVGTLVFVVITLSLFAWKFHRSRKR